jgi:hypothetical protein
MNKSLEWRGNCPHDQVTASSGTFLVLRTSLASYLECRFLRSCVTYSLRTLSGMEGEMTVGSSRKRCILMRHVSDTCLTLQSVSRSDSGAHEGIGSVMSLLRKRFRGLYALERKLCDSVDFARFLITLALPDPVTSIPMPSRLREAASSLGTGRDQYYSPSRGHPASSLIARSIFSVTYAS